MHRLLWGAGLALCMTGTQTEAADDKAALVVQSTGFENSSGHAIGKLFAAGDNVVGPGRWQLITTITEGKATFRFADVPPGNYAVVVFHDENDNGRIDHNWLRMPSEALGFSNGFVPSLLAGMPTFEKLQFVHTATEQQIDIRVAKVLP